jgi:hypothetical protein
LLIAAVVVTTAALGVACGTGGLEQGYRFFVLNAEGGGNNEVATTDSLEGMYEVDLYCGEVTSGATAGAVVVNDSAVLTLVVDPQQGGSLGPEGIDSSNPEYQGGLQVTINSVTVSYEPQGSPDPGDPNLRVDIAPVVRDYDQGRVLDASEGRIEEEIDAPLMPVETKREYVREMQNRFGSFDSQFASGVGIYETVPYKITYDILATDNYGREVETQYSGVIQIAQWVDSCSP